VTDVRETCINGRWVLRLPAHRAERPEWDIANGGWEPERITSMASILGPGDVLYDCGAEQGDMPGLFSSLGCDLVLIEPNPLAWPNIKCVWDANDLRPALAWWVGFASDTDYVPKRADVAFPFGTDGWPACAYGEAIGATGFRHLAQEHDVTSQITLDSLAARCGRPPTAITIDVEGSELRVLKGSIGLLVKHKPIVWVSIHSDRVWMDEMYGGVDVGDVYAFMENYSYEGTFLAFDHEEHHVFRHPEGR